MKHRIEAYLWNVKDGIPESVKLKNYDFVYVKQEIEKEKDNDKQKITYEKKTTYIKKPVEPTKKDYDKYTEWIKDKNFFYPYDFQKVTKKYPKYKINGIIAKLLEEKKIVQYKGDEFKVLHKEVIENDTNK